MYGVGSGAPIPSVVGVSAHVLYYIISDWEMIFVYVV